MKGGVAREAATRAPRTISASTRLVTPRCRSSRIAQLDAGLLRRMEGSTPPARTRTCAARRKRKRAGACVEPLLPRETGVHLARRAGGPAGAGARLATRGGARSRRSAHVERTNTTLRAIRAGRRFRATAVLQPFGHADRIGCGAQAGDHGSRHSPTPMACIRGCEPGLLCVCEENSVPDSLGRLAPIDATSLQRRIEIALAPAWMSPLDAVAWRGVQ
jgi:hypothetical protein